MTKTELENKLQRRCQQIMKDGESFVFKTHGSMYTRAGIPDLVACVPVTLETLLEMMKDDWFKNDKIGIFVSLEIKRADHLNELSKAQEIVGREIVNAGGIWLAIDDSDVVEGIMKTMRGELCSTMNM